MKKYIINLERRPDRLDKFFKNCPINDIEIIYAFDGKFIKKNEKRNNYENECNWFYNKIIRNPGERGCFISHIRILEEIVAKDISMALVFEDDVIFDNKDFKEIFDKVLMELPNDFNILYLGGHTSKGSKICTSDSTAYIPISEHISRHKGFNKDKWHYRGTFAHIISLNCAKIILNEFYKSKKINMPLDHWLIHNVFQKNRIPILNSVPLICWGNPAELGDSDIRGRHAALKMTDVIT